MDGFLDPQAKAGRTRVRFLTSVTRLSCEAAVTLAVGLAQAGHPALPVFTLGQTAGVGPILVLLITQNPGMTRLAAAGVGVRVDGKAGAMDTPEDGDTGKKKIRTKTC